MRKYLLYVFLLSILLFGCKTVTKSMEYYNNCKNDTECYQLMLTNGNITNTAVSKAVGTTSSNGALAEVVGLSAGAVASFLTGIFAGRKLKRC